MLQITMLYWVLVEIFKNFLKFMKYKRIKVSEYRFTYNDKISITKSEVNS